MADFEASLGVLDRNVLDELLPGTVLGSPASVKEGLKQFIAKTAADEIIITAQIFDHQKRLLSYELTPVP